MILGRYEEPFCRDEIRIDDQVTASMFDIEFIREIFRWDCYLVSAFEMPDGSIEPFQQHLTLSWSEHCPISRPEQSEKIWDHAQWAIEKHRRINEIRVKAGKEALCPPLVLGINNGGRLVFKRHNTAGIRYHN